MGNGNFKTRIAHANAIMNSKIQNKGEPRLNVVKNENGKQIGHYSQYN